MGKNQVKVGGWHHAEEFTAGHHAKLFFWDLLLASRRPQIPVV